MITSTTSWYDLHFRLSKSSLLFATNYDQIIIERNKTMTENLTYLNDDSQQLEALPSTVDLRYFLVRIFYPCLLIWGTIGNALCLRVLLSKKFIKNSTCQYLAVLAVIDILFIVMRSSKQIYKLFRDTSIFNTSLSICRTLTFFSSALAHMASWILVIVSFDRYLIVTSRYRRQNTSVNRVFCSTSILIAVVLLCNLYYFFIQGKCRKCRMMSLNFIGLNLKSKSMRDLIIFRSTGLSLRKEENIRFSLFHSIQTIERNTIYS